MRHSNELGKVLSVADKPVEQLAVADEKIGSFEKISAENEMRNVSHNDDVGKGSAGPKVSLSKR